MKNILIAALVIIATLLLLQTCKFVRENNKLKKDFEELLEGSNPHKPETILVNKPFVIPEKYKDKQNPVKVKVYKLPKDSNLESKTDSLISFDLNSKQLKLSLWKDSSIFNNIYPIDLEKYKYTYSDGVLTYKKSRKLKLHPYVGAQYKYFNNFFGINGGILLETKHLNYKLGVDYFYLPNLSKHPKTDISLEVIYKF